MRKIIWKKSIPVLMAAAISFTTVATSSTVAYAAEAREPRITVQGEGAVSVRPNIAYISLGVSSEGEDVITTRNMNEAKMVKLLASIKEMDISDEDIQTSNYSISQRIDYNRGTGFSGQTLSNSSSVELVILGYTVSNNVNVTVRDLESVGQVLHKAIEAGANVVGGINFAVEDPSEYYEKALVMAMSNAKSKAIAIATALDVNIGTPVEIMETSRTAALPISMHSEAFYDTSGTVPIEAGNLTVWASIQAVYNF